MAQTKKEQWMIRMKKADFYGLGRRFNIDPVTARLLVNRDVNSEARIEKYLHGTLKDLYDPHDFKDIERGTDILAAKIRDGRPIRIISDYDVDGVTSNYILYKGLKRCGARVDYAIPHRILDGYGINERLIGEAHRDGIDTIITCDNGISARSQIAYAKSLGMTVVVTDHHDVPFEGEGEERRQILPPADAVINPKQDDCPYPNKICCGAVVAWKFIQVLYEKMQKQEETGDLLEMAAFGTVCDVMPLRDENRIIVREGIRRMRHSKIPGLRALIDCNELNPQALSCYHLGFVLGPCVNASGRLSSAQEALALFLEEDEERCQHLAGKLKELNEMRKDMTARGVQQARACLEESGHETDKVLVVYLPDVHESIAGIIAGRIREVYNKPTFVITKAKTGLKGSGRSIEAYSMFEELTKVQDLLEKYGGHPMAAGLSLKEENLEPLRQALNENAHLTEKDFVEKVRIDVAMPVSYVTESLLEEFRFLEPCGTGNERPLFAQKDFRIERMDILGKSRNVLKFRLRDSTGYPVTALWFQDPAPFLTRVEELYGRETVEALRLRRPNPVRLDVTYQPSINEWNGTRRIQIVIRNYRFRGV